MAAETPSNGHFIAAHFRVATGPAAEFNQLGVTEINPTAFSFVGPDNLTVSSITSAGTYSCLPDAQNLPGNFGPGQQYAGDIVFDLPATHGALIYHPDQGSGWEWDF